MLRGQISAEKDEAGRAAIMMIALVLRGGGRVDNPLKWPISREVGRGYRYLPEVAGGTAQPFATELILSAEVAFVEVSFRTWRPEGPIVVDRIRLDLLRRPPGTVQLPSFAKPQQASIQPKSEMVPRETLVLAGQPVCAPVAYDVEPGYTYVLGISAACESAGPRAFVLQPRFDREDGSPATAAPKGFGTSSRFGHFTYLDAGETTLRFAVPADARRMRVEFHSWGAKAGTITLDAHLRLVAMSEWAIQARIGMELEALLAGADPNGTFLCIYTGTKRIGEGNRANRSMMFARDASRLGYTTIYTYSPAEAETDYSRTNDRLLQVPLSAFPAFAALIATRAPGRHRLLLGSMPDLELCRTIGLFKRHGWRYVYECRDEWEEFAAVSSASWYDEIFERYATAQAARVFCVSRALQAKMRRYTTSPEKVVVSPNATTDEFLASTRMLRPLARRRHAKSRPTATPRIGYFGHLTEQWFDWGALLRAADLLSHARFEIIGFDMPNLQLPPNMQYLGSKTHEEIIEIAQGWDVGLIPFKPGRLSRAVDPIKVYEYLALGIKVVSVPMGSLEDFPLTFCYQEFGLADALSLAIAHRPSRAEWENVESILSRASWRLRLIDLLEDSGVGLPRQERSGEV